MNLHEKHYSCTKNGLSGFPLINPILILYILLLNSKLFFRQDEFHEKLFHHFTKMGLVQQNLLGG